MTDETAAVQLFGSQGTVLRPGDPGYWSGPSDDCKAELERLRQVQIAGAISLMTNPILMD